MTKTDVYEKDVNVKVSLASKEGYLALGTVHIFCYILCSPANIT